MAEHEAGPKTDSFLSCLFLPPFLGEQKRRKAEGTQKAGAEDPITHIKIEDFGQIRVGMILLTCISTATSQLMISDNSPKLEHTLNPLATCTKELEEKGFTTNFKVEDDVLKAVGSDKTYQSDQVKIVNFFRFEGTSDPSDMTILYAIETNDGVKGTLVDAFGTYANPDIDAFLRNVHGINKKNTNTNVTPEELANSPSPENDEPKVFS